MWMLSVCAGTLKNEALSIGISICGSAILGKWLIPLTQPLQYKEEFVSEFLLLVLIWKVTDLSCVP